MLNNNNRCAQILQVNYDVITLLLLTTIDSCHTNITLGNSDWINDIRSLLAKVEMRSHSRINNLDVTTVKELCHVRDNSYYN